MKTADSVMMNPVISELNRVPNFDPLKFLRNTESGPRLDLKYKKLWFRLKYPNGRIRVSNLRVTDQLAIIEARVFFDRKDTEWVSNYTAQCDITKAPNGEYLKAAQDMAIDQALTDAGFGIQLTSTNGGVAPAVNTPSATAPAKAVVPETKAPPIATAPTQTVATPQNAEAPAEKKAEMVATEVNAVQPAVVKAEPVVVTEEILDDTPTEAPANVQKDQATVVNNAPVAPPAEKVITMPAAQTVQTNTANQPVVNAPVASAPVAAPVVNTPVVVTPKVETTPSFSKDMSVEELCAIMTLEDAENYVVPSGACAGQKMSMVAERRAASLRFYMNGYKGDDNILRAAATIITNAHPELLAG